MSFFSRLKPSKKKETKDAKGKTKKKSAPSFPVVDQAQNSGTQTQKEHDSNDESGIQKQVLVVYPEKKDRILSIANIIAVAALITSGGAVYFAAQANKQIADQFDIENRPLVILKTAQADTIKENTPVNATLVIKNVGKTPAYFIYARFGHSFDIVFNPQILVYTDTAKYEMNRFIESGSTFTFNYLTIVTNPKIYVYVRAGKTLLHNFGEVVYKDIISGKKYSYKFSVQILPNGQTQPTQIGDRVTEIKD